jgi:hypothetical protein
MAKKLWNTLVTMFDARSARDRYLSQSVDMCDLENRMKRLHTTSGRFGI